MLDGRLRRHSFNGAATLQSRKGRQLDPKTDKSYASMGPRLFSRGKHPSGQIKGSPQSGLDRAATLQSRKGSDCLAREHNPQSFNGAATLQSRKDRSTSSFSKRLRRFNGAATLQSRKGVLR